MIRASTLIRFTASFAFLCLITLYIHHADTAGSPATSPAIEQAINPTEVLIPKIVHQLLLSMPGHSVSTFKPNPHSISWQRSGWKVEYWSEEACAHLAWEVDPKGEYLATWEQMGIAVLKSDFCRYLIMYGRGGVYSDLDVHLMKSLPWEVMGPAGAKEPPALIIGLEGDKSTTGLPRSPQCVQWTMASASGHPVLRSVLDRIASQRSSMRPAPGEKDVDVMNLTGPSVWTDTILAYLECSETQLEQLRDLKEPVRIKDVLVLPKRAFAIIQGDDHRSSEILVKHYFSGTWKTCTKAWYSWMLPFGC